MNMGNALSFEEINMNLKKRFMHNHIKYMNDIMESGHKILLIPPSGYLSDMPEYEYALHTANKWNGQLMGTWKPHMEQKPGGHTDPNSYYLPQNIHNSAISPNMIAPTADIPKARINIVTHE